MHRRCRNYRKCLLICLSENRAPDYLQIRNEEFLDMFLTAKHLEGCSDKTIRYYRCNIQRMLETVVIKENLQILTETYSLFCMLLSILYEYSSFNFRCVNIYVSRTIIEGCHTIAYLSVYSKPFRTLEVSYCGICSRIKFISFKSNCIPSHSIFPA